MARRQVIELRCDRCERVETQPLNEKTKEFKFELEVSFQGQKVEYEDLCRRCRSAVENYFKSMTKQPEEEKESTPKPKPVKESGFLGMGGKKAAG